MILAQNIQFKKEEKNILDQISFSIEENEFIYISGSSGSGKSALMQCLCLQEKVNGGSITFQDNIFYDLSQAEKQKIKRTFGIVFQSERLDMKKTVHENVAIPLYINKIYNEQTINETLEIFHLLHVKESSTYTLSTGQRKKLCLAQAIIHQPKVLFLDEPFAFLDEQEMKEIMDILKYIYKTFKITVILSTKDSRVFSLFPQRVLFLKEGRLSFDGTPVNLSSLF